MINLVGNGETVKNTNGEKSNVNVINFAAAKEALIGVKSAVSNVVVNATNYVGNVYAMAA